MDDPQLRKVVGAFDKIKKNVFFYFIDHVSVGLVGHTSNMCCPLCTYASNPDHPSNADNDDHLEEAPDKRPKKGQSFEWSSVTLNSLEEAELRRNDDEWRLNQRTFQDLLHTSGVTPSQLARKAVTTGMRDTCLAHLKGLDF